MCADQKFMVASICPQPNVPNCVVKLSG
jgi:hypothetical protein